MNGYIEKLLSYIKDKDKKTAAREELSDHYIEKQRWYEDMGYDELSAAQKTEADIGDPDVIGAQLASAGKRGMRDWLFMPFLIAFLVYYIISNKNVIDWLVTDYVINFALFVSFIVLFIKSLKRHLAVCAIASCVLIFLINKLYFINAIALLLNGYDASACFFGPYLNQFQGYSLNVFRAEPFSASDVVSQYPNERIRITALILTVLFIIIMITGTAISVSVSIKVKKLKNSLTDYKLCSAVRRIFISILVLAIVTVVVQLIMAIGFEVKYKQSVSQELTELNGELFDEIEKYHADKESYTQSADNIYDSGKYLKDKMLVSENVAPAYFAQTYAHRFYGFNGRALRVNTKEQGENVIEFVKTGKYLEDAPKPYSMIYDYKKDDLIVIYDCDHYGAMYLKFSFEGGRFELTEDYKIRARLDADFSEEQLQTYEKALNEYNKDRYSYLQDDLPAEKFKSDYVIYGISFVEPEGCYEVYQYSRLDADVDEELLQPIDRYGTEVVSVEFIDGEAVIKNIRPASKNSYYNDDKLSLTDIDENDDLNYTTDQFFNGEEMLFSDEAYRRVPLRRINNKPLSYYLG